MYFQTDLEAQLMNLEVSTICHGDSDNGVENSSENCHSVVRTRKALLDHVPFSLITVFHWKIFEPSFTMISFFLLAVVVVMEWLFLSLHTSLRVPVWFALSLEPFLSFSLSFFCSLRTYSFFPISFLPTFSSSFLPLSRAVFYISIFSLDPLFKKPLYTPQNSSL